MKKFKITAQATIEIATLIEAENKEEAVNNCEDREVNICIHGSEMANGYISETSFVLTDGEPEGFVIDTIEEYE